MLRINHTNCEDHYLWEGASIPGVASHGILRSVQAEKDSRRADGRPASDRRSVRPPGGVRLLRLHAGHRDRQAGVGVPEVPRIRRTRERTESGVPPGDQEEVRRRGRPVRDTGQRPEPGLRQGARHPPVRRIPVRLIGGRADATGCLQIPVGSVRRHRADRQAHRRIRNGRVRPWPGAHRLQAPELELLRHLQRLPVPRTVPQRQIQRGFPRVHPQHEVDLLLRARDVRRCHAVPPCRRGRDPPAQGPDDGGIARGDRLRPLSGASGSVATGSPSIPGGFGTVFIYHNGVTDAR